MRAIIINNKVYNYRKTESIYTFCKDTIISWYNAQFVSFICIKYWLLERKILKLTTEKSGFQLTN